MKTDDLHRALTVSDVQDGVEISSPDPKPKPKGHARDQAPKAPPEHVSISASNTSLPFKLNFPQSTSWPYRMIISNHQIATSNIKKLLNAPSRKIIRNNPRGRR